MGSIRIARAAVTRRYAAWSVAHQVVQEARYFASPSNVALGLPARTLVDTFRVPVHRHGPLGSKRIVNADERSLKENSPLQGGVVLSVCRLRGCRQHQRRHKTARDRPPKRAHDDVESAVSGSEESIAARRS